MAISKQVKQKPKSYLKKAFSNWQAECNSAVLYQAFVKLERSPKQAKLYKQLADLEEKHANYWKNVLVSHNYAIPVFKPRRRTQVLIWLAKRFGLGLVLPQAAKLEQLEAEGYLEQLEPSHIQIDEQASANLLKHLGHEEFNEFVKKIILRIRRPVLLAIGGLLFFTSIATAHNVQIEGLFFGLFTASFFGAVLHYLIGKIIIPLPFGRVWCGWACWTAALLDQLPYKKSAGWLPKKWHYFRYLHFFLSLALVALMVFGFKFRQGGLGQTALFWFLVGNLVYWLVGVILDIRLKDNRAFCKYVCPISLILKQTSRPALLKVSGDASSCLSCKSQACTTLCPMDIDIPAYIKEGKRVLSNECILCLQCVAVCPPNTLEPSFGLDWGGENKLELRKLCPKTLNLKQS